MKFDFKVLCILVVFATPLSFAQLPTAQQVASHMTVGWNLGNSLEAICDETAASNPLTTQKLIDSVKAAGYDAVRLPCAWTAMLLMA